jgi:hypothetical protein
VHRQLGLELPNALRDRDQIGALTRRETRLEFVMDAILASPRGAATSNRSRLYIAPENENGLNEQIDSGLPTSTPSEN